MGLIGVGQSRARHPAAESHVVQLSAHRPQAGLDVAKALAVSQLCEGHRQILVTAREASAVRITAIAGDTLLKLVGGQVVHQLDENSLTDIHPSLSAMATSLGKAALGPFPPEKFQIEKTTIAPSPLIERRLRHGRKL